MLRVSFNVVFPHVVDVYVFLYVIFWLIMSPSNFGLMYSWEVWCCICVVQVVCCIMQGLA